MTPWCSLFCSRQNHQYIHIYIIYIYIYIIVMHLHFFQKTDLGTLGYTDYNTSRILWYAHMPFHVFPYHHLITLSYFRTISRSLIAAIPTINHHSSPIITPTPRQSNMDSLVILINDYIGVLDYYVVLLSPIWLKQS